MLQAPMKPEYRVVLTAVGRAITPAGARSKSKIYLLEDKRLVVVYANGSAAEREEFVLESASFSGKNAKFTTADGRDIHFTKAPCNCGMGVVAHAAITPDNFENRVSVRPPEWVTGL